MATLNRQKVQDAAEVYKASRFPSHTQITLHPSGVASGWVAEFWPVSELRPIQFEVIRVPSTHFGFVENGVSFTRTDAEGDAR